MRFGFHFIGCADERDGGIWIRGQFGRFVDALAARADRLDLLLDSPCTASPRGVEGRTDYRVRAGNVGLVPLGPHGGFMAPARRLLAMHRALPEAKRDWDFLLVRQPSRRSPAVLRSCRPVPTVFLLGGDHSSHSKGFRPNLSFLRARYFHHVWRRAGRTALFLVNNERLMERWRPFASEIVLTRTTSYAERDMVGRPTIRFGEPPPHRLLFVGRLNRSKGIADLLEALSILNRDQIRFLLDVVGDGEEEEVRSIRASVSSRGQEGAVRLLGYQPLQRVLELYREADAFVLPTLEENLSRCIWEAMSQGCPVVTTPVGGQGLAFTDHHDLLFAQPGDAGSLAERIDELATSPPLSAALSARGLALARENTAEIRARELVDTVTDWLARRRFSLPGEIQRGKGVATDARRRDE